MNAEETLNLVAKQWCTLEDIMKLGHASTKETLDTYAHMFPNNLGDVKNTIDNLNLGI